MDCTIYKTADIIGKRWTLLILLELYKGEEDWKRYSDVKRGLKEITPKIFSERLRELEKEKMIKKKVDASTVPIKSEYSLTSAGKDFIKIIQDMKKWALKWKFENKECLGTNCKDCVIGMS